MIGIGSGCRIKVNCPHALPGLARQMPCVRVLLPSPDLHNWRNPQLKWKLRTVRSTIVTGARTRNVPFTNFNGRSVRPER